MKVTGFSFLKNAITYGYPVLESIRSILPICDEFVIAIGKCDDGTLELIQNMNEPKIKIIETEWDESLREGGHVLAVETDKAFKHISKDTDWAFYLQADEVVHEKYLDTIYKAMQKYKDEKRVDGLLFKYVHFYGSFDYVGTSSNWYSHEIRVIKNKPAIYSYKDAQGFRIGDNKKLMVKAIDAIIYHYGWVREPEAMQRKQANFRALYRSEEALKEFENAPKAFAYEENVRKVALFEEEHPQVMKKLIQEKNWKFEYDISMSRKSSKDRFKDFLKNYIGLDTNYKNYKIIKN
ncbi:MAG: glycosyltransferase family 2 protein [Flavobacteriaceae bacterium]